MGSMSWNPATKALVVSGTLYLDGNLVMSGGNANYTGTGTIYVNGRVAISGNMTVCGPGATSSGSTCTGKWNAALGALAIVAVERRRGVTGITSGSCTSPAGWSMSGNAQIDVLAYVVGCFQQTGTSYVTGPVTTDQGVISGTPTHTDVTEPATEHARCLGIHGLGLVGARRTQQLAPDAGGTEWPFSPYLPVPMMIE